MFIDNLTCNNNNNGEQLLLIKEKKKKKKLKYLLMTDLNYVSDIQTL